MKIGDKVFINCIPGIGNFDKPIKALITMVREETLSAKILESFEKFGVESGNVYCFYPRNIIPYSILDIMKKQANEI